MTGIELIAEERQRQIDVYGYSDDHILSHPTNYNNGELADAAACYALDPQLRTYESGYQSPDNFPWADNYWKPGDRIRELSKAGAMIIAEIDRLQTVAPDTFREDSEEAGSTHENPEK